MVTTERKQELRSRVATAKTWQERKAETQARLEAWKTRVELEAFSLRLHAYALTPEGAARAQLIADRVYDQAKLDYHLTHHTSAEE